MIKINPLYEYEPLKRHTDENGIRYYESPTGEKLSSVTTILSLTGDKTGLFEWRKRVGDKEANRISKEASALGTLMHTHLDKWLSGEPRPEGNNVIRKLASKMADVVIQSGMKNITEVWGQEAPLYYPGLYSGTTDLVGLHKDDPAIIDFKTSTKMKKEEFIEDYRLQLCGYAAAHNILYGTNIRKGVIFMVTRNFEFQEFVIQDHNFDNSMNKWIQRLEQFIEKFSNSIIQ